MDFGFILKLGDAPLGINDITKSNHAEIFSLYPNPSDSKVNIQLNELYKTEKYTLSIYTLDGKKIFRKKEMQKPKVSIVVLGQKELIM